MRFFKFFLAGIAMGCLTENHLRAEAKYFEIEIKGSYSRNFGQEIFSTRKSLGFDLDLPLLRYFELSLGHTQTQEEEVYTDQAIVEFRKNGYTLDSLSRTTKSADTNVNFATGLFIGPIRPGIFGGALWRKVCVSSSIKDYGCTTTSKPSWNAGLTGAVYLTERLKIKVTYRLAPSYEFADQKGVLDELVTLGLSWGI